MKSGSQLEQESESNPEPEPEPEPDPDFGASLPEPEPDLDFGAAPTWVRCTHVKTGLVGQWQSVKVLLAEALTSEMVAQNFDDQLQDMRRRITESAGRLGTRLIERLTDVVERWRTERTATVHIELHRVKIPTIVAWCRCSCLVRRLRTRWPGCKLEMKWRCSSVLNRQDLSATDRRYRIRALAGC